MWSFAGEPAFAAKLADIYYNTTDFSGTIFPRMAPRTENEMRPKAVYRVCTVCVPCGQNESTTTETLARQANANKKQDQIHTGGRILLPPPLVFLHTTPQD